MGIFRLFQISDLHFSSDPERDNGQSFVNNWKAKQSGSRHLFRPTGHCPELAEHLAVLAFEEGPNCDLIIVTGDAATTGLQLDLYAAFTYIDAAVDESGTGYLTGRMNATLRAGDVPIFVIPGNHDRYKDIDGAPGGQVFDAVFRGYWPPTSRIHHAVVEDFETNDLLGLIAADFSLLTASVADSPQRLFQYGQGYVDTDVLNALIERTKELKEEHLGIAIVWISHFPPSRRADGFMSGLRLIDFERLLAAARQNGIQLILSGHLHRRMDIQEDGVRVLCAGSATAFGEDRNWAHRVSIETGSGRLRSVISEDYFYDNERLEQRFRMF